MKKGFKYLILILSIVCVLNNPVSHILGIDLNLLDEGILFMAIFLIFKYLLFKSKVKVLYFLLILFIFYSIIISIFFGLNKNIVEVVLQSLISIKFFIVIVALFLLFKDDLVLVSKMYNVLFSILLVGFFLNIIIGEAFTEFLGIKEYSRSQLNIIRYGGFVNPNHLGYFMVLSIGLLLNKAFTQNRLLLRKEWLTVGLYIFVILLTDSRSALLGIFLFFMFFYKNLIIKKAEMLISFVIIFLISLISLIYSTDVLGTIVRNIEYSFSLESHYIRGILINMSVQIAYLYFPIGTGAATFGSIFSEGSKVYQDFGVANTYFFMEKTGIYDSSLASWLGEYGFLGVLFLFSIFNFLSKYLIAFQKGSNSTMINGLLLVFLFFSITNPTFTNSVYIFLSFPIFFMFSHYKSE